MTGEQLYQRWIDSGDPGLTGDHRPWDRLNPYERDRWEGMAAAWDEDARVDWERRHHPAIQEVDCCPGCRAPVDGVHAVDCEVWAWGREGGPSKLADVEAKMTAVRVIVEDFTHGNTDAHFALGRLTQLVGVSVPSARIPEPLGVMPRSPK